MPAPRQSKATTPPTLGEAAPRPSAANRSEHPAVESTLRELGARLRRARVVRDIPLAEMAARMGVQARTLGRLERGAPGVAVETLALALWHMNLLEGLDAVASVSSDAEGERLAALRMPRRARGRKIVAGDDWAGLNKL